jgi:hypothetical protein
MLSVSVNGSFDNAQWNFVSDNVEYTDNVFLAGKHQRLTVHYELEWMACSCSLFTLLTGDVVSAMKWRRLKEFPPSPQAFIISSSLFKWRVCFFARRGRWFLTLASPRYEIQASIL